MYKNTTRLFDRVAGYQKARAEIMAEYDAAEQNAARFKGSSYYDETMRTAKQKRDADILTEKKSTVAAVRKIAEDMRQAARNRKFTPPSTEAVNTLQVLRMMEKPNRETCEAAERFLADSPLALAALDDISTSKGVHLTGVRQPSAGAVINKVNSLEQAIYRSMNDASSTLYGRVPKDETSFFADYGAFGYSFGPDGKGEPNQRDITAFCDAVNIPEVEA